MTVAESAAKTTITRLSQARRALAAASTLEDVLKIRDQAEALRTYIKVAGEGLEAQNAAAEFKLRAERKAGEMLAAMDDSRGRNQHTKEDGNAVLPSSLEELGIDKMQSSRWQREAKVPEEQFEEYLELCRDESREVTQAGLLKIANGSHVSLNSGENEWYTPHEYIEAAREAMGSIDLDPSSCEAAQANVKASVFYDIEHNGLEKKWSGNVWLNPPYGKEVIKLFASKLVAESSRFKQAVVLVNNATDTAWFHDMLSVASALCFIRGRIRFLDKNCQPSNLPVQGQVVLYVGNHPERFVASFFRYGVAVLLGR